MVTPELGAAIGFGIAALILALRLVKRKKPVWAYKTELVMGLESDTPPELKLYYRRTPVESVYKTRLIFFNKGTQTINEGDVTEKIAINFKGSKILRKPAIMSSKKAIKFSTKRVTKGRDSLVQLDFLYLDHNDGAVIEVLHTETEKIEKSSGNIKGTEGISYVGEFTSSRPPYFARRLPGFIILLGIPAGVIIWMFLKGEREFLIMFSIIATLFYVTFLRSEVPRFLGYMRFPKWSRIEE